MDPTQRNLVHSHITILESEAAEERLAAAARSNSRVDGRSSIRLALGHRLMSLGATISAAPLADDPCADGGAAQRA